LTFQIQKHGGGPKAQPQFQQIGNDMIIGSTSWANDDGSRVERYQVITHRDGRITDMQGFASRRAAERFAHKRVAVTKNV
jgi:hypothetical protein